jgi:ABC-2 type transport system permease protein
MIRAAFVLAIHSARRLRGMVIGMAVVLAAFQVLLAAMADWLSSQSAFHQIEGLVPPAMRALMGQSLFTMLSVSGVVALGYFHTAIEAALIFFVIVIGSEPADEIDAGFADLVLSRPVRRRALMVRTMALLLVYPALLVAAMGLGTAAGTFWMLPATAPGPSAGLVLSLMLNLWALLMAWGGIAMAVASVCRRRSRVTGIVGLAALVTLLVDYLARAWTPFRHASWISPFHYFSPLELVMGVPLPWWHIVTLLSAGVVGAVFACIAFDLRDL